MFCMGRWNYTFPYNWAQNFTARKSEWKGEPHMNNQITYNILTKMQAQSHSHENLYRDFLQPVALTKIIKWKLWALTYFSFLLYKEKIIYLFYNVWCNYASASSYFGCKLIEPQWPSALDTLAFSQNKGHNLTSATAYIPSSQRGRFALASLTFFTSVTCNEKILGKARVDCQIQEQSQENYMVSK
jgi:hypothetical protein